MTDKELAKVCKEYAPKFKAKYLDYFTKPHIYGIAPAEVIASLIRAEQKKKPDTHKMRYRVWARLDDAENIRFMLLQQRTGRTQQDIVHSALIPYIDDSLSQEEEKSKCANITT